uniref:Rab GTPase n=1 Tax=Euplotoides octocarinatus TaxID=2716877 RepID=Q6DUF7_EUPOC|nr:Rab GTPase [Euplotes octocarinatus]
MEEVDSQKLDYLFKVLLVGNSGSGKTSIISRLVGENFNEDLSPTKGIDFRTKDYQIDLKNIKLHIWELPRAENSKSVTSIYMKNCSCVIVVYDITDKESLEWIDQWFLYASPQIPEGCVKILCGNKLDLLNERAITTEEGISKADQYSMYYYETSALEGVDIDDMFEITTKEMKIRKDNDTLKTTFVKDSFYLRDNKSLKIKKKKGC